MSQFRIIGSRSAASPHGGHNHAEEGRRIGGELGVLLQTSENGKRLLRSVGFKAAPIEAVAIEFADTGEGLTAENPNKIWNPIFTTKPEGKSTGLGLAICRRLVEEHWGTIDIQSQPGRGTSVRLLFPATSNGAPG